MLTVEKKKPATLINEVICQSPGRINLVGGHTDYNDGYVLPAAIDKKTTIRLQRNGSAHQCTIYATNLEEHFAFDLKKLQPLDSGWQNYVMGVVDELMKLGGKITGFDGEFEGTVPIGSGMSSSAALECSLAFALNELFTLGFSKVALIKATQLAEHHFVGMKCGIMDQFTSVMGQKDKVLLLDCRTLDFDYFPLALGRYEILMLNSKVSHELANSEYNLRRAECEKGVAIIQKKYPDVAKLRDVSMAMLQEFKEELSPLTFKRCHHVVSENQRVLEAVDALKNNNLVAVGKAIYGSHFSLQRDYEVSCPELDFLVDQTLEKPYILGARMMGGGFGGCTLNIIRSTEKAAFLKEIKKKYKAKFGLQLIPYSVAIEDGASLVSCS